MLRALECVLGAKVCLVEASIEWIGILGVPAAWVFEAEREVRED